MILYLLSLTLQKEQEVKSSPISMHPIGFDPLKLKIKNYSRNSQNLPRNYQNKSRCRVWVFSNANSAELTMERALFKRTGNAGTPSSGRQRNARPEVLLEQAREQLKKKIDKDEAIVCILPRTYVTIYNIIRAYYRPDFQWFSCWSHQVGVRLVSCQKSLYIRY